MNSDDENIHHTALALLADVSVHFGPSEMKLSPSDLQDLGDQLISLGSLVAKRGEPEQNEWWMITRDRCAYADWQRTRTRVARQMNEHLRLANKQLDEHNTIDCGWITTYIELLLAQSQADARLYSSCDVESREVTMGKIRRLQNVHRAEYAEDQLLGLGYWFTLDA